MSDNGSAVASVLKRSGDSVAMHRTVTPRVFMKFQSAGARIAVLCCVLQGCAASAPVAVDPSDVRIVEADLEPEQHLELPRTLDGCEHRGMVRVHVPEGTLDPRFLEPPPGLLDQLKALAASKGADTLVVLPGKRALGDTLRGSAFSCSACRPVSTGAATRPRAAGSAASLGGRVESRWGRDRLPRRDSRSPRALWSTCARSFSMASGPSLLQLSTAGRRRLGQ